MPWTGKSFARKHNHSLKGAVASKAAEVASAIVREGGDEGKAIRIANSNPKVQRLKRRGLISDRAAERHGL